MDEELRPPARGPRARRRRPASRAGSGPDRGPITASVRPPARASGAGGQGRTGQRPGDESVPCGYREDLLFASRTDPVDRPASPHTSAPPWRVRALHRAVGGGSRREPSCVEVGRRPECTVGGEPEAADVGRQGSDGLGDRVVGRGHPGKRATGLGVLGAVRRTRPAAGGRGRARCCWCGDQGPRGNELWKEPGDRDRRAGRGEPLAGQVSGSPRVRTSPVATVDAVKGTGQPVARKRSGGPPGLTPGTATAPRGTGGTPRGPADDAALRGRSATAGEGAAGWIVGVLGISRSTTGGSISRR